MTATDTSEECIELCNSLLRGERSALDTFDKVIQSFGRDPRLAQLHSIRDDHAQSVAALESNVIQMGGTPDSDSGAWGTFASAIQSAANLFGEESAVCTLQQGEEKGRDDYADALKGDVLLPECHTLISTKLLPRVQRHIATLQRLQEAV